MKYKSDIINKLDAATNLLETLDKSYTNNTPYTKEESHQLVIRIQRLLEFVSERLDLESQD